MLRTTFGCLILLISVSQSAATDLTLFEALHRAMIHNRMLAALRNRVAESNRKIEQAKSSYLPQFRLNSSYIYLSRLPEIKLDIPSAIKIAPIKTGSHNVFDANLSGSYLLCDFGKRAKTVAQARLGRDLAEIGLASAAEETAYQLVRVFATATLQAENVKLIEKYVAVSERHLQDANSKFTAGLVSQFDLLKSEVQLKAYQEQLAMARIDRRVAELSLTEICGGDTTELYSPADSLITLSINSPQDVRFDTLILQKPQVRTLQKQQSLSQLSEAVERLRPTLTVVSSIGWKNNYMPEPDKPLFNYAGGLSFTFSLFDGGYSRHRRQEEREKQRSYQLDIDRIASESRRRVDILYQEMRKIDIKTRITAARLILARKAMEIASVSYGAGLITNSDYLDTEIEVHAIETQALNDRFALLMIQLELKKELGYFPEIGGN